MINIKRQLESFDVLLFIMVLAMCVFGIFAVSSALKIYSDMDNSAFYKQIIWVVTGFFLLVATSFIDYRFISRFYVPIYIFNLALLAIVLFMPTRNNVARWIAIGPATIQPSEFTKIFMIVCLAKWIDKKNETINNIKVVLSILIGTGVPVLLIKMQPSLSASLVTLFIMLIVLYVGNLSYIYFLISFVLVVPISVFFYMDLIRDTPLYVTKFLDTYQIERILPLLKPNVDPDLIRHTAQSVQALASGQLGGKGLYHGIISQHSFLPNADNDFIFAVIGEEFGFIGCIIVLFVMLMIILKCIIIAIQASDLLGRLIATGVAAMFAFQTFVNVGVATGLLPNTGMPFPFLSAGGSSMWVNMIAVGLVINVGMAKQKSIFEG